MPGYLFTRGASTNQPIGAESTARRNMEKDMSSAISLNTLSSGFGMKVASSDMWRAVPTPRSSMGSWGQSLLQAGANAAGGLLGGAGSVLDVGTLTSLLQQQPL